MLKKIDDQLTLFFLLVHIETMTTYSICGFVNGMLKTYHEEFQLLKSMDTPHGSMSYVLLRERIERKTRNVRIVEAIIRIKGLVSL